MLKHSHKFVLGVKTFLNQLRKSKAKIKLIGSKAVVEWTMGFYFETKYCIDFRKQVLIIDH